MNCPSRTDENILLHPDWNQNPPRLNADLTTREDLNGRVNSRQYKDGSTLSSSSSECANGTDEVAERSLDVPPPPNLYARADAKFLLYQEETCSATEAPLLKRYLTSWICTLRQWFQTHQNWVWWGTIATLASFIIYYIGNIALSYIPKSTIRTKAKRNQSCQGDSGSGDYNTPLHVGALFIILFVSFSTCAFPMLVVRFPRLHIPTSFLFVVRHFGTGVLIATAFVHLLPTSFIALGNPCLSKFWTTDYPAIPGAIALAAIFLVATVEMVFSPARHICSDSTEIEDKTCASRRLSAGEERLAVSDAQEVEQDANQQYPREDLNRGYSHRERDSLCGRSTSMGRGLARMGVTTETIEERTGRNVIELKDNVTVDSDRHAALVATLTPEQKRQKAVMQCVLLEIGILFHSVFIGMALSVTVGNKFVILLIAVAFHQTFEGLALGSRIASLSWDPNALQPWIMALLYGCTTPVGQALGLATHTLYDPDSEVGLIMVGTMNAISSGLLVYASLVELLSEDFLSDESWRFLRGKRRVYACLLVFLGAFGMSLIGAWA